MYRERAAELEHDLTGAQATAQDAAQQAESAAAEHAAEVERLHTEHEQRFADVAASTAELQAAMDAVAGEADSHRERATQLEEHLAHARDSVRRAETEAAALSDRIEQLRAEAEQQASDAREQVGAAVSAAAAAPAELAVAVTRAATLVQVVRMESARREEIERKLDGTREELRQAAESHAAVQSRAEADVAGATQGVRRADARADRAYAELEQAREALRQAQLEAERGQNPREHEVEERPSAPRLLEFGRQRQRATLAILVVILVAIAVLILTGELKFGLAR